jgi:hypothetical protein
MASAEGNICWNSRLLEFARLASKRWRYYRRSIPTIVTPPEFKSAVRANPRAELNFIIVARAGWFSDRVPLGLAQCRRTFCNHFVVEFLAVHPRAQETAPRITGLGSGILYSLASLALELNVPLVWGEATEYSAPFYKKIFGLPTISDHFFVYRDGLSFCARKFKDDVAGVVES